MSKPLLELSDAELRLLIDMARAYDSNPFDDDTETEQYVAYWARITELLKKLERYDFDRRRLEA